MKKQYDISWENLRQNMIYFGKYDFGGTLEIEDDKVSFNFHINPSWLENSEFKELISKGVLRNDK
jgi:hypothetical protein